MQRLVLILIVLCCGLILTSAQDDIIDPTLCPAVFESALINTQLECANIGGDELCVGNLDVVIDSDSQEIARLGDRLSVVNIERIATSPMDTFTGEWGIVSAQLVIQDAEFPVTMVAFGDTEIENLSVGLVTQAIRVTSNTGAFVREQPDSDADVLTPLSVGAQVIASGRLDDSSWIQVILSDGRVGWIASSVVAPVPDESGLDPSFEGLVIVDPENIPDTLFLPFRAFNFRSGILDNPCPSVPESGILLQTPDTQTDIMMQINGVLIELAGTAFIQAQALDETPQFYVLEGELNLITDDGTLTIPAGDQVSLSDGVIRAYDYARMEILPLELLPREFVLPVDWLSVIIPAQANPLEGLTVDDDCTVVVVNDVNVRVGPGTEYAVRGSMLANQSAYPTGRAIGNDARIWWRLTDGAWLSFDVTIVGGNCNDLPTVAVLPRP